MGPAEIFQGVNYRCLQVPTGPEASGLMHVVEVDLSAAGIELYTTPLDPAAQAAGHEYLLAFPNTVLQQAGLSVLINGTLHRSRTYWLPLPGDWADSVETVVSAGQTNHVDENSYLLWFDEHLHPTLEKSKPLSALALQKARCGIAGQGIAISSGLVSEYLNRIPDARTMIGIDTARRQLWLATFENASEHKAAELLAEQGALDAMHLDGGSSTTFGLGPTVQHAPSGIRQGGWRPVATYFGVRALPVLPATNNNPPSATIR